MSSPGTETSTAEQIEEEIRRRVLNEEETETETEEETETETEEETESEEHEEEETEEETETETEPEPETGKKESIKDRFERFRKTNSPHKYETPKEEKNEYEEEEEKLSVEETFKIRMVAGLFFMICNEVHAFIFSFFSKYKISADEIGLDEKEQKSLDIYFRTRKVMDFINKLNPIWLGIIHMEYLYFQKFREISKKHAKLEAAENNQEEEEEEEKEETTKKKRRTPDEIRREKEAARRRKWRRKKKKEAEAAKKAA